MADVRIEINSAGVAALLKSPEVLADLERRGQAIAAAAGEGHEVQSWIGRNRARVTVRTATTAARVAEATDRSLTSAIGAAQ